MNAADRPLPKAGLFWAFCFWTVAAFQAVGLIRLVAKYGVNILFSDQWAIFDPLFKRAPDDWWHLFFFKHGHGEGLGLVLESIWSYWTRWDIREEGFIICLLFVLVFLIYAAIRRQCGPLGWFDLIWPLLCLTPRHYEAFLITPHPAYGPVPALLVAAIAWVILRKSTWWRDGALLLLYFFALFTGYGCILAPFLPVLFACEACFASRDHQSAVFRGKVVALLLSLVILGIFAVQTSLWQASSSTEKSPFSVNYFYYVFRLYAHAAGLNNPLFFFIEDDYHSEILGLGFLGLTLLVIVTEFKRYLEERDSVAFISCMLAGFSLLYASLTAVERTGMGLDLAYTSRYVAYMLPGVFAVYFFLAIRVPPKWWGKAARVCIFVLVAQAAYLGRNDQEVLRGFQAFKKAWVEEYLRTGNVAETNRLTGFSLCPNTENPAFEQKMQFLRERHLNLFKDSP